MGFNSNSSWTFIALNLPIQEFSLFISTPSTFVSVILSRLVRRAEQTNAYSFNNVIN